MDYSLTCVTPNMKSKSRNYCHTDCGPADRNDLDNIKIPEKKESNSKKD